MARKTYSPEFRRQAVDLYRCTPNTTVKGIAADLGISRHTLQVWVQALDPDRPATPTATIGSPATAGSSGPGVWAPRRTGPSAEVAALQARVAALQAENDQLVAEQTKLATERDILRQAAKYFAGETRW